MLQIFKDNNDRQITMPQQIRRFPLGTENQHLPRPLTYQFKLGQSYETLASTRPENFVQKKQLLNFAITKIRCYTVLFFDLDGTLVETDYANFLSYQKAVHEVAKSDKPLVFSPTKRINRTNLKVVVPGLSKYEYDKIVQIKEQCYNDFLHETKLIDEIANLLFSYSETNKTVLVTNCRKERAMAILDYHNLTSKFSNIFCRQKISTGQKINKYEYAVSALKISPKEVIAFENEAAEILDAHNAGIDIIIPIIL